MLKIFKKNTVQSNTIKVQFIDNSNDQLIGIAEMLPDQLPETFEIATTLSLKGEEWVIENAIPANSSEFIQSKQLILKMGKMQTMNPQDILFTIPTISNELPPTGESTIFNDFELTIHEDDWRQNEFLLPTAIPLVNLEIDKIKSIWKNNSKAVDEKFTAFDKIHVRENIGEPKLNIEFNTLTNLLGIEKIGSVILDKNSGFVKNSFAFNTSCCTYYGTVENNQVTTLCINTFTKDSIEAIKKISSIFNLIFVDWCNCNTIQL